MMTGQIDKYGKSGFMGLVACFLSLIALLLSGPAQAENTSLWKMLNSPGHVALVRHALAPGTGDPARFDLTDCQTQRNLSDEGRQQAERIGERFRTNGIAEAKIYTSQWCRCRETAELFDLGPVSELPILNSFFQRFENRDKQTQALRDWLTDQPLDGPLVLVTHQVNISALTGAYAGSGEIVIIRRSDKGEITVVGSIKTS